MNDDNEASTRDIVVLGQSCFQLFSSDHFSEIKEWGLQSSLIPGPGRIKMYINRVCHDGKH